MKKIVILFVAIMAMQFYISCKEFGHIDPVDGDVDTICACDSGLCTDSL